MNIGMSNNLERKEWIFKNKRVLKLKLNLFVLKNVILVVA